MIEWMFLRNPRNQLICTVSSLVKWISSISMLTQRLSLHVFIVFEGPQVWNHLSIDVNHCMTRPCLMRLPHPWQGGGMLHSHCGKQHGSSLWKGIFELQLARYWTSSPLFGFPGLSSSCVFSFIAAWGISFQIARALSICWKLHNFLFSSNVQWVISEDIRIQDKKKSEKKTHIFLTSPAFPAAKLRLVTPYTMHLHA